MVLGGEEGLECEVCIDGTRLEQFSDFKYLGYLLDESSTDDAEYGMRVMSERRVPGAIWTLVN